MLQYKHSKEELIGQWSVYVLNLGWLNAEYKCEIILVPEI